MTADELEDEILAWRDAGPGARNNVAMSLAAEVLAQVQRLESENRRLRAKVERLEAALAEAEWRGKHRVPSTRPRYVIDHRSGCIAIHDTHHPGYARRGLGCHSDDPWCVYYASGVPVYSTCNGSNYIHHWEVSDSVIVETKCECNRLNWEHEAEWRARR